MSRRPPDPVQVALAQAVALNDALRSDPEIQFLTEHLIPLLGELRHRAGLLPCAVVEPDDFETGFERWWAAYPVKVAKLAARKSALAVVRQANWPGWEAACQAVAAQRLSDRWKSGTIPNPATWLWGGRWLDDPATMRAVNANGRAGGLTRDELALQRENEAQERMHREEL